MLPLGRNKVPGQIKQGGGLDSALGPCVCHLCNKGTPAVCTKRAEELNLKSKHWRIRQEGRIWSSNSIVSVVVKRSRLKEEQGPSMAKPETFGLINSSVFSQLGFWKWVITLWIKKMY